MIIDDIVDGYYARQQVYILQNKVQVFRAEKNFLFLTIVSYERDIKLLQTIIDNQIEESELEAMVTANIVEVEKKKKNTWRFVAAIEGALIILLIITAK